MVRTRKEKRSNTDRRSRLEKYRRERREELDREQFNYKLILGFLAALILIVLLIVLLNPYKPPSPSEGEEYLKLNVLNDPDVKVTNSGLQYKVLHHDESFVQKPSVNTRCKCNYIGTLIDGTIFDEGVGRVFTPHGVIKGWQEALLMMSMGDKYKLFIPSHLAYGNRGKGSLIPPGSVLIFELTLVEMIDPVF